MMKYQNATNKMTQLVTVKSQIWPWGQRSPTMVRDTSSGGGLPTCQIWKAYLERQKSYSPDMICYGRTDHYMASATKWRGPNNASGRGPPNEHFCQVWSKSVQWFQRRRWKYEKLTDADDDGCKVMTKAHIGPLGQVS